MGDYGDPFRERLSYAHLYAEEARAKLMTEHAELFPEYHWPEKTCPCGYGGECGMHCGNGHETGQCEPEETSVITEPDYRSPFKIPECNDPHDAERYQYSHAKSSCPVHSKGTADWAKWAEWREEYATAAIGSHAEQYARDMMLKCVTMTNPPDAPLSHGIWMKTSPTPARRMSGFQFAAVVAIMTFIMVIVVSLI